MIDYELFKRMVLKEADKFLPENYKERGVNIMPVSINKVNGKKDGITIKLDDLAYAPTIYLDAFYDMYRKTDNFYDVMDELGKYVTDAFENGERNRNVLSGEDKRFTDKSRIYFEVINTEYNRELLFKVPHREVSGTDLSLVYRYLVSENSAENAVDRMSILITNEIQSEMFNMTETEMYDIAKVNTIALWPVKCQSLYEQIKELLPFTENIDVDLQEMKEMESIYMVSNADGCGGAVAIEYTDTLNMVSEIFANKGYNGDFYIIPSSRHEILCIQAAPNVNEKEQISSLEDMVASANIDSTNIEDRLSFNVYKFDSSLKKVMQMTDSTHKLDDRKMMQYEKVRGR